MYKPQPPDRPAPKADPMPPDPPGREAANTTRLVQTLSILVEATDVDSGVLLT